VRALEGIKLWLKNGGGEQKRHLWNPVKRRRKSNSFREYQLKEKKGKRNGIGMAQNYSFHIQRKGKKEPGTEVIEFTETEWIRRRSSLLRGNQPRSKKRKGNR